MLNVRRLLPIHSGPPPLVILSNPDNNVPAAGKKWEDHFFYNMGGQPLMDRGVPSLDEATSIVKSFLNFATPNPLLPVESCPVIAVAKPLKASAHMAYHHRLVYSTFEIELLHVLKGVSEKHGISEGGHVIVCSIGGIGSISLWP
jgi:hypothetical protein